MLRKPVLLFCVIAALPVCAFHIEMHGVVTDHFSGDPLKGVQVRMVKDGIERETVITKRDGSYSFTLDRGYTYLIWFHKEGLVTKHVRIDATQVPPIPDVPFYELDVQVALFQWVEGVDLTLFEQPLGLAEYVHSVRKLTWDVQYTKTLEPQVARVMVQYERRMGTLSARRRGKSDTHGPLQAP